MRADIGISWWLTAMLMIGHAGAFLIVTQLNVPLAVQGLLVMVIAGSLILNLRRHAMRISPEAITGLELRDDGSAAILRRTHPDWQECELRDSSVHTFLVIVRIARIGTGRFSTEALVIPRDALDAGTFRELRVWLRWRRNAPEPDQPGDSTVSAGGLRSSGRG